MADPSRQRPDVDDDDLDDLLDNVLDDFQAHATKPPGSSAFTDAKKPTPFGPAPASQLSSNAKAASEGSAASAEAWLTDDFEEEFARQLAEGMGSLMGDPSANDKDVKSAIDSLLKGLEGTGLDDLMGASSLPKAPVGADTSARAAPESSSAAASSPPPPKPAGESQSFRDKIQSTINKLDSSSEQADTNLSDQNFDSMFGDMMKQMEGMADGGNFEDMVLGLLTQVMTKDVLYEPMKELSVKYPDWLAEQRSKMSAEDLGPYERQYEYVRQIVTFYDAPDYEERTKHEDGQAELLDLMRNMQDCGQPPKELLKEIAPDMEHGSDGMPKLPGMDNCSIM